MFHSAIQYCLEISKIAVSGLAGLYGGSEEGKDKKL